MSNNNFTSLPCEIQSEIFTFLSLKHLSTILSINKYTYQSIDSNKFFWDQLINNYSKIVKPITTTDLIVNEASYQENQENSSSNIEKHSRLLKELIETKKLNMETLQHKLKSSITKKQLIEERLKEKKKEIEIIKQGIINNENQKENLIKKLKVLHYFVQNLEKQSGLFEKGLVNKVQSAVERMVID